jgi:hypothetical protein
LGPIRKRLSMTPPTAARLNARDVAIASWHPHSSFLCTISSVHSRMYVASCALHL